MNNQDPDPDYIAFLTDVVFRPEEKKPPRKLFVPLIQPKIAFDEALHVPNAASGEYLNQSQRLQLAISFARNRFGRPLSQDSVDRLTSYFTDMGESNWKPASQIMLMMFGTEEVYVKKAFRTLYASEYANGVLPTREQFVTSIEYGAMG